MKTSRILFISFFSLIGTLLIITPLLIKGTIKTTECSNSSLLQSAETKLPSFNHIKVLNNSCTEISDAKSGDNRIVYSFPKDSVIDEINFTLVGDTLILPYQDTRERQFIKVKCGHLKTIHCANPLSIEKAQDTLNVHNKWGQTIIRGKHFKQLNLTGTGGAFGISSSVSITELNANLCNTKLEFGIANIDNLNATLTSHSKVIVKKARNININKDDSSHFRER